MICFFFRFGGFYKKYSNLLNLLEWTRGAGSPAVPIVSYVTYVTGDELLRLLELLFRSSGVTIFEHLEPLFEPNPHYWDHFRGPKTGGTDGHRTNERTYTHGFFWSSTQ